MQTSWAYGPYLVWGHSKGLLDCLRIIFYFVPMACGWKFSRGTSVKFGAPKSHRDVCPPSPPKKLCLPLQKTLICFFKRFQPAMHSGKMYIRHLFHYGQFRFITYKIITNVVEFLHIHGLSQTPLRQPTPRPSIVDNINFSNMTSCYS